MAEEFSKLEATLMDAARQGNINHVIALLRDVGRLHHLWQVSVCCAIPQYGAFPSHTVFSRPGTFSDLLTLTAPLPLAAQRRAGNSN
jgi:hypothetical protein